MVWYGVKKLYRIKLTKEERSELEQLINSSRKVAALKVTKARSLLLADESGGSGLKDPEIIKATGIKESTLERLRKRVCEVGPLEALERKKRDKPPRESKITGEVEAKLIVLACSEAPEGCQRWTLQLLADKLVELKVLESISSEAVRTTLKKTRLNPGRRNAGVFRRKRTRSL